MPPRDDGHDATHCEALLADHRTCTTRAATTRWDACRRPRDLCNAHAALFDEYVAEAGIASAVKRIDAGQSYRHQRTREGAPA